jgi:hypothetical protein
MNIYIVYLGISSEAPEMLYIGTNKDAAINKINNSAPHYPSYYCLFIEEYQDGQENPIGNIIMNLNGQKVKKVVSNEKI